jgi:hypothetical protein
MIAAFNNKSESSGSEAVVENIRLEGRLSKIEHAFSEKLLGYEQLLLNQGTEFNMKLKNLEQVPFLLLYASNPITFLNTSAR